MADVADAQVGDRHDMVGYAERVLQRLLVEDADPADAQPLGARRQPQVLHGAHAGIEVHGRHVGAAEHHRAAARAVAGDAQVDRCVEDALQLELAVDLALLVGEHPFGLGVGCAEDVVYALFYLGRADDEEIPWLHEADRRRVMRRQQDARELFVGDRVGQELTAHVAAVEDGTIDGGPFGVGKSELVFHGFPFWKRGGTRPRRRVTSPGRSSDSDSPVAAPSRSKPVA